MRERGASMLVQLSVVPLGVGVSVRKYVADALEEIDRSGLEYRLSDMGTTIEGEWDEVMDLLKRVHDRLLGESVRVLMHVSIDSRKDKTARVESKVREVEESIGRPLKK